MAPHFPIEAIDLEDDEKMMVATPSHPQSPVQKKKKFPSLPTSPGKATTSKRKARSTTQPSKKI